MSIFEKISDEQLIKYLKYLYSQTSLGSRGYEIHDFWEDMMNSTNTDLRKALAPLKKKELSRLDIEYLYELISLNSLHDLETGIVNRPSLKDSDVDFVTEERRWVRVIHSESMSTYTDITTDYLYSLNDEDEITPWDWEIVEEDILDSDSDDWWFEIQ